MSSLSKQSLPTVYAVTIKVVKIEKKKKKKSRSANKKIRQKNMNVITYVICVRYRKGILQSVHCRATGGGGGKYNSRGNCRKGYSDFRVIYI